MQFSELFFPAGKANYIRESILFADAVYYFKRLMQEFHLPLHYLLIFDFTGSYWIEHKQDRLLVCD